MKNRSYLIGGLFVLLLVASTAAYALWGPTERQARYDFVNRDATTTPEMATTSAPEPEPTTSTHGYGAVTIRLNEAAALPGGLSIRPVAILEDSRCPMNARCIQAGTVRLSVRINSGLGASAHVFEPGTTITTEAERITLLGVAPENTAGQATPESEYRFTFEVALRDGGGSTSGGCYVGGCSAQLCTDDLGAASDCEYRPEYACYQTAKCERQTSGQCGWTHTPQLNSCLLQFQPVQ